MHLLLNPFAIDGSLFATLPRISVVTPVFNGCEHIAATLESVLNQGYPELEYIVVDGGSTDGTLEIIRSYQFRKDLSQEISLVISEPDRGMYDAIAKGFERATGEIFCYLNADDLFECGGLRPVGEYFARHPETQVIYHEDAVLVDGWKFPNVRQPENVGTADLLGAHILFQDGVFFRRTAYEAIGGVRRDLKLAGDFDLWLRLSAHFRFVRRPGHVSCFRIRPGQLSSRMDLYHHEMRQSIADFLLHVPVSRRAKWFFERLFMREYKKHSLKLRGQRLFFPIDFGNLPPPAATIPPGTEHVARSPIDGLPVERLLFTTPDTRFGESELNYIYLDERHGIAVTHPHKTTEELDAPYQKHYSCPSTEPSPPRATSPYRQFNRQTLWEKVLLSLPVGILARTLFPLAGSDNTLRELIKVLEESNINPSKSLRFLDVGCFEGHLLDEIRGSTSWNAYGLEPNNIAAAIARGKGHRVWSSHAENVDSQILEDRKFDVIYMGQSIEQVNNPVTTLVHLKPLLAPGGVLVVSTPNLDSREVDWFGPTWVHWHPPYHRQIFSKKGLHALAQKAGFLPLAFRSFSNTYWTAMSLAHNAMGLGGSASHAVVFDPEITRKARRISFWKEVIWNRMGRGDYCFFAMKKMTDGVDAHDG